MVARITLAEIDTLRMSIETAVERFQRFVPGSSSKQASGFLCWRRRRKGVVLTFLGQRRGAEGASLQRFYARQLEVRGRSSIRRRVARSTTSRSPTSRPSTCELRVADDQAVRPPPVTARLVLTAAFAALGAVAVLART